MLQAAFRNPLVVSVVGAVCSTIVYLILSALTTGVSGLYTLIVALGSFLIALSINLLLPSER
jgi:hypothetical protein